MNAAEFIDYCRTIAASTASEPIRAPILDAGLAIQFLLPAVMREAVRRVAQKPNQLQSLIRPHFFTVTNGCADMATSADDAFSGASGLEEEFSQSFQVGILHETLVRTNLSVDKHSGSDEVISAAADFVVADAGRRIIILVDDVETVNAIITAFTDSQHVDIGSYETGDTSTNTGAGMTALIYDPISLIEGEFTPVYLGLFSLVEQYADFQAETSPLLPIFCVRGGKIFVKTSSGIDDGTVIVVYGISVPQIVDETSDIDASDDLLDTALMIAASLFRGEMPIGYLGIPDSVLPPKMAKK